MPPCISAWVPAWTVIPEGINCAGIVVWREFSNLQALRPQEPTEIGPPLGRIWTSCDMAARTDEWIDRLLC